MLFGEEVFSNTQQASHGTRSTGQRSALHCGPGGKFCPRMPFFVSGAWISYFEDCFGYILISLLVTGGVT